MLSEFRRRAFTSYRSKQALWLRSTLQTEHCRPACRRSFMTSQHCYKRVTRGKSSDILGPSKTPDPSPKVTEPDGMLLDHNAGIEQLPKLRAPTGSVVLDAVREFTEKYPTCVLLMQVGDFYELYEDHASQYASQLDLKLTKKEITSGTIVDFAGFPLRSLDRYLELLVNRVKCNVALCEQYITSSGHLKRKITRIITPGTLVEERFLDAHEYNYLLAVHVDGQNTGLAWIDMSVGDFIMQKSDLSQLQDDLARIRPREILLPAWLEQDTQHVANQIVQNFSRAAVTFRSPSLFDAQAGRQNLNELFKIDKSLEPPRTTVIELEPEFDAPQFGDCEIAAAQALMEYVDSTQLGSRPRLQKPIKFDAHEVLRIDNATMNSLEVLTSIREGKRADSLLGVIDCTATSAGSRLLNRWLVSPLTKVDAIEKRLDIVDYFYRRGRLLDDVRLALKSSNDAQRALQRLSLKKGQHSDLLELKWTLKSMKTIKQQIQSSLLIGNEESVKSESANHPLIKLLDGLDTHDHLTEAIANAIDEEYVIAKNTKDNRDFGYVKASYNKKLLAANKKLIELENDKKALYENLRSICGASVSLVTNSAYKHVVEVGNRHAQKLKDAFTATLVNQTRTKHRYQIEEWTKISVDIENTSATIIELESQVYEEMCETVLRQTDSIIRSCRAFSQLDVLSSFARLALDNKLVRPSINDHNAIQIIGGRHPVVEASLYQRGRQFIKNDCHIHNKETVWLLTGPNMGGKSTFLRQTAVILLLGQIGCYVPAKQANIGIADRIFSRVGASDNLAQNQSTFMVEMMETANILKNATSKSFVIMDEVGRGTATHDGLSLAYSILHYIHEELKCRTLFATHYHDLADMLPTHTFDRLACYKTTIEEDAGGGYIFNHRITPGVCRKSHGIKVAQIAVLGISNGIRQKGIPQQVIALAYQTMHDMEKHRGRE